MRRRVAGGLLAALSLALAGCAAAAQPPARPEPDVFAGSRSGTIEVSVDRRIELLSVIQLLSGYFLTTQHDTTYKREVASYFAPHANHRAVTLFKEMSAGDFRFSDVPDAVLRFSPPPALDQRMPITPAIAAAAGGEARLLELIAAMRDFAQVSDFESFYRAHEGEYGALAERARPGVTTLGRDLQSYTGQRIDHATVVLGPLLHDGGFAALYDLPGGRAEAFAFIGPVTATQGQPDFGDERRLSELAAHEFAHLVVNPLTAASRADIDASAANLAPIARAMQRNGYSEWHVAVSEHVIRGLTARLIARRWGEAEGEAAIRKEVEGGFAYAPAVYAALRRYEADRAAYPTLADFYPELIAVFAAPLTS
jgi:hypothetical protein